MNPAHNIWTPLLLSLAATAPLLLVYARRSTFQGFGFWTAGSVSLCAAALANGLGALAGSAFLRENLVVSFLLLSYFLFFVGCRRLRGHDQRLHRWVALWLLWVAADFWLSTHAHRPVLAHAVEHLAGVMLLGASVWTLLQRRPAYFGIGDATFAGFAGLVAAFHSLRLLATAPMLMTAWAAEPMPAQAADTITLSGFKAMGFALSQLMVLFDRKAWEVEQTARDRREVERLKTFESFFEHAPVPLMFTTHRAITSVNSAFRRLFGLPPSGPLDIEDFWHHIVPDPQERQAVRSALDGQLLLLKTAGDSMPPTEFRLHGRDSQLMNLMITGRQLHGGVLVSLYDIGPLRQLQERLRDSEERYRFAMSASRDGLWDWDIVKDHVHFSNSYLEMIGRSSHESHGNSLDTFVALLHPDDRASTMAFVRSALQEQESFEVEFRLRHQKGHDVWVLSRGLVVQRDTAGAPSRVVGTHTDITERKSLELHLKSALEQQRTLLQAAPLGICAVKQGQLVQCNARMHTLFAELPIMLSGCRLFDLIPEEELRRLESPSHASAVSNAPVPLVCTERALPQLNGQVRWLRFHGQSVSGQGLWHDGILVVEDVTEARRITEQLVQSLDAADSAVRATHGLLANLRHEVNTPLHAILGFAELLSMPDHNDVHRQAPKHIRQAALQLQSLLRRLHDLAAAYAQPISVCVKPLDLLSLCEQSLPPHREAAQRQGLQLKFRCDAPSSPLHGDPELLQKAIDHLLRNALQHTAQGFIELRVQIETPPGVAARLRVEVADSGSGVPIERREHLFKPIIATDFSDVREAADMGLSEVQRIAQALQGHAYHQPREPQGSVFGFTALVGTSG